MSENKRTPKPILEEVIAFYEKIGVSHLLEEFLSSESVTSTVKYYAQKSKAKIQDLIDLQDIDLAARAEEFGVNSGTIDIYNQQFPNYFRIALLHGYIAILRAFDVEEDAIATKIANAFMRNHNILYVLVDNVCKDMCDKYFDIAHKELKVLESDAINMDKEPDVTCDTCGQTEKCQYDIECEELGFCPKGREFHCNGKGKANGECNCPCVDSCTYSAAKLPCEDLDFTVIPPKGGCCERGVTN